MLRDRDVEGCCSEGEAVTDAAAGELLALDEGFFLALAFVGVFFSSSLGGACARA